MQISETINDLFDTVTGFFSNEKQSPSKENKYSLTPEHEAFLRIYSIMKDWYVLLSKENTKNKLSDEQVLFFIQNSIKSLQIVLAILIKLEKNETIPEIKKSIDSFQALQTGFRRERIVIEIPKIIEKLKEIKEQVPYPKYQGIKNEIMTDKTSKEEQVLKDLESFMQDSTKLRISAQQLDNKETRKVLLNFSSEIEKKTQKIVKTFQKSLKT